MSYLFSFHQVVGKKTRAYLAKMLRHLYQSHSDTFQLTVHSKTVDEITGRRLAGVIFLRYDHLDVLPYEPLFLSYKVCSYEQWQGVTEIFEFNPDFCQLLKRLDSNEFEKMIADLTKQVDGKFLSQEDLRFE